MCRAASFWSKSPARSRAACLYWGKFCWMSCTWPTSLPSRNQAPSPKSDQQAEEDDGHARGRERRVRLRRSTSGAEGVGDQSAQGE